MALEQQYISDVRIVKDRLNVSGENAYMVHPDNIISITISENVLSLLPKIDLIMNDSGDVLHNRPFLDQDMLYVTMGGRTSENEVSMIFTINSFYFESDLMNQQGNALHIVGYLASDGLLTDTHRRSYKGSSDKVIGDIASNVGLTYDNRVSGIDSVVWYQNGSNYQFINHVAKRSYVPNDGVFVYGTSDSGIVYTSYNTELAKGAKFIAKFDTEMTSNDVLYLDDESTVYYDQFNYINNTTMFNTQYTYGMSHTRYDLSEYAGYEYTINSKTTDYFNMHKDYAGTISSGLYMNAINDKSYVDNIYRGKVLNEYYKYNLFSDTMLMNVNVLNDIKLFDIIDVDITSLIDRVSTNEVYSGLYFVVSISYTVTRNGRYTKEIMLSRYGINKSFNQQTVEVE